MNLIQSVFVELLKDRPVMRAVFFHTGTVVIESNGIPIEVSIRPRDWQCVVNISGACYVVLERFEGEIVLGEETMPFVRDRGLWNGPRAWKETIEGLCVWTAERIKQ